MGIGTWQVGTATQLGLILMIIGMVCAFKPYETAKWHKNDPDAQEREHKRIQSHRRKKNRVEFDTGSLAVEREPSPVSIWVFRILGAAALVSGAALAVWSFL